MMQCVRRHVSMAVKMFTFLSFVGVVWVYRRYFKNFIFAEDEENARLSRQYSELEDELREEATKQAQERDPTLKRGSPHPPRKES